MGFSSWRYKNFQVNSDSPSDGNGITAHKFWPRERGCNKEDLRHSELFVLLLFVFFFTSMRKQRLYRISWKSLLSYCKTGLKSMLLKMNKCRFSTHVFKCFIVQILDFLHSCNKIKLLFIINNSDFCVITSFESLGVLGNLEQGTSVLV